ncbi:MAG: CAAD domain-containing protein [Thermosynechococcaceae cyanobacterium]
MNSDPQNQPTDTESASSIELSSGTPGGALSTSVSSDNSDWKEVGNKVAHFLDILPDFIGETFNQYRKPLSTVAVIVLALVSVAIADGVLDVINALPLVAPLLELVGLGYTGWFIWRYLLYADKRKELGRDYQALKNQVTGKSAE